MWRTTAADINRWYAGNNVVESTTTPLKEISVQIINHVHPGTDDTSISTLPSKSTARIKQSTVGSYDHSHLHYMEDSRRLAFELDWATAKWEHVGVALKSVSPLMLATWREIGIKW